MIYVGVDPGINGAMAILEEDGSVLAIPYDESAYNNILQTLEIDSCKCCIEQVHAMPQQGVSSTFTFGKNYGIILGMLKAHNIPYQEIPPQRWKKEFGLNSDKAKSIDVCQHLFPNVSLKRTQRCTKDHDGIAEALLMAEFARRKL